MFGSSMISVLNLPWLTLDNFPTLIALVLILLITLLITSLLLLRRVKVSQVSFEAQQQLLQQLAEKVNLSYEVNANNQQQLQQQLSFNHQQLATQQNELKTYFEQQISDFKLKLLRQHGEQGEKQAQQLHNHSEQLKKTLYEHHVTFSDCLLYTSPSPRD